jgi:hypothetical protein
VVKPAAKEHVRNISCFPKGMKNLLNDPKPQSMLAGYKINVKKLNTITAQVIARGECRRPAADASPVSIHFDVYSVFGSYNKTGALACSRIWEYRTASPPASVNSMLLSTIHGLC